MWVSCGKILYLYFGKPIVSVSYSCVISYSKTQLFRTESIYYGSWVHRSAWYLSWSESDSTDLSCPCSCVCDYLVVSCGLAGLGWPHVFKIYAEKWHSISSTTFSWPHQITRTAQIQRIALLNDGKSWKIILQRAWTGMNEELGKFLHSSIALASSPRCKINQEIIGTMLFIHKNY